MVIDAAVLVISNQKRRAFPKIGIPTNRVIDGGDEYLARLDVMVRMLVGS
jgi:hypothetical protein